MDIQNTPTQPVMPKKPSKTLGYIVGAIIILGLSIGSSKQSMLAIQNWFADLLLNKYDSAIQDCVKTQGPAVIGEDYTCAIQVAAGFYNQDPENATRLCLKYQFPGLKENTPELAKELCVSEIKKKVETK